MHNDKTIQQEAFLREARVQRQRLRRVFDCPEGRDALSFLERRFRIDLPVFQGKAGQYDPLDAMKRDAHREVFLYIRHQLELAIKESVTEDNND